MAGETMKRICHAVGTDITESKFLERIMQLLYDSDLDIKVLAIDTVADILEVLSEEFKKEKLLPILIDFMSSINEAV
eukprot:CAMPEP_0114593516 /NCGR_PEP_ID=MMETSP0125-20121206/15114_1 /TAXON_ID=485358 ORGANISM="Aristerostoma sp., Strain ATCC 50986" /NCGR_SAMPLE_ID=MMETSP0125 /ASSEMBLY_ACC=CAM_ASM_000245 /LENGTH=76 /DNA_ID=CAMNT_0001792781 /DNA_START=559 /DNA_END=789 /DNA_ORIENTATION=+